MGIIIYPAGHEANALNPDNKTGMTEQQALKKISSQDDTRADDSQAVPVSLQDLDISRPKPRTYNKVISSSFPDGVPEGCDIKGNGFVQACIEDYSRHQHLVISPDDVWLAILAQFSFYVNAHAEMLRDVLVGFKGKKELTVRYLTPSPEDVDWEDFAREVTKQACQHLRDPKFRDWVMPKFSTTTKVDETAASVAMMASMQNYFVYHAELSCGLPSVTLLGNREDYYRILGPLSKLRHPSCGPESAQFADLLTPIICRFISSFDDPKDPKIVDFWKCIFTRGPLQSGPRPWSGWISAFMFWGKEGKKVKRSSNSRAMFSGLDDVPPLVLDGVVYESVTDEDLAPGFSIVPIKITLPDDTEIAATMLAGSVAVQAKRGAEESESAEKSGTPDSEGTEGLAGPYDTRQPVVGWWLYKKAKVPMRASESDPAGQVSAKASLRGGQPFSLQVLDDAEDCGAL